MLKILNAEQIKALDTVTIEHDGIAAIDLMERACRAFVNWFVGHFDQPQTVGIVCGTGNNGGDGMGIARLLKDLGFTVRVWVIRGSGQESIDFTINLDNARKNKVEINDFMITSETQLFGDCDILIDAIFGSGLNRPAEGTYEHGIALINNTNAIKIAVDIPSGLMLRGHSTGVIVQANYTISFQLPKLPFFLPQYYCYTGFWTLVDIGLNNNFIRQAETAYFYVRLKDVRRILRKRSKFDHKGVYGHALLIAGSYGKIGAAVLASRAVLRSGSGLLTVHSPKCGYAILQSSVPEALVQVDKDEYNFTETPDLQHYSSIGFGPGLGLAAETVKAFGRVMEQFRKPMVIDADGLNILSANREMLHLIPVGSILTPHPKEFERLVGKWQNDFERLEKQKQLAAQLKSIIIVKGAHTAIAHPEGQVYFNSTGNPGMATGGSGDVLTGILTGLLAQQYSPLEAALLGVYLHGLAGDLALPDRGMNSLIASDLIDYLPASFLRLRRE